MKLHLAIAILAPAILCARGFSQTFTTRFEGSENPISENGKWQNEGIDWTYIQTQNGLAYGTQTGTNTGIYKYNDSFAHLSGFPPDQEAWGEVRIANPKASCIQELEILLRWTSSPHRTTGYECFARCVSNGSSYVQIVRWDGPLGKFTYLADMRGTNYGLKNGDILKASIIGNLIMVYVNGVEKAHAVDDSFKTGNPGIGEYFDCEGGKGAGANADFGFFEFTARAIGGGTEGSSFRARSLVDSPGVQPLECYATSDLDRVFEDGYGSVEHRQSTLNLFGLRNETISGQCVLLAQQDLNDLTLSLGPLRQTQDPAVIPEPNVQWNFVASIFIEKNSPNRQKETLLRPAPAWFPDYLSDNRQCSLRKGERKAVYLTLKIPPETPPGEYGATITAKAGSASASLPVIVQVYPLTLPEQRHLFVTEWFSTSEFKKHHQLNSFDGDEFYQLLKVYAQNMVEHRQNAFRVGLESIEFRRSAEGKLQFDFSHFDKMVQVFWDTGRMDLLETGFVAQFGSGGWSGSEIVLDNFPVTETNGQRVSVSGEKFLPEFLPTFVDHLRVKGWLTKTVFHICDEPSDHNVMAWRNASEFVHRFAPELRRIDAIETPHCLGALEVWVPKLDHFATWQEAYKEAQRPGNQLWFYTVGIYQGGSLLNKTVDVPLIETRLMHWLNYRYNLQGYLHWGFNAWTDDPIKAPGQHRGDGWHVYPKKDGLLNSVRWEQMRNGLQDYECLWLLENKISQLKASLPVRAAAFVNPRQRGVEISAQVIADYYHHTQDPEVLYRARRQAIDETLALEQSPRVLLQTTPLEHSAVAKGCVIDVHGWAEPGTSLIANGQTILVADDGLFLAQLPASADNQIVIEARRGSGKRRLVRQFQDMDAPPNSPAKN
jgi:hypothetical protein